MLGRKHPAGYRAIAQLRGAVLVGPEVQSANTRIQWRRVGCGPSWWTVYDTLR